LRAPTNPPSLFFPFFPFPFPFFFFFLSLFFAQILSPFDPAEHPAFQIGRVAVITGAASGIGRAAALQLVRCVLPLPRIN